MRILSLLILSAFLVTAYRATQSSPHGPGLKISCKTCHSTKGWQFDRVVYSFDHSTTRLPLSGQHTTLNCRECHVSLVFSEAQFNCIDCHKDVHQSTVGTDCSRCHTPESWLVSDITGIHRMSRFPLLGAHRTADCVMCHKSENPVRFDVLGVNCIDCHRDKFLGTTNPNHVQSGFSEDCTICHKINAFQWEGAGINHDFFPLRLGHGSSQCADCHTDGTYSGLSPACYSCHQADYLGTTNPNHSASQFSTSCQQCHSLNPGWKPATFDHSTFPLTQGHAGVACTSCHVNGNYSSTSPECSSCHLADFNGTTNPAHKTLNFPLTCTTCHTTNPGWKPASYRQHDTQYFPIFSGRHNGKWTTCADCHNQPSNFAVFTCISCHEHSAANTNGRHSDVRNYTYTATSCYTCHPNGTGDD
jgi:hypothetical protein